jgi:hypothetical protein
MRPVAALDTPLGLRELAAMMRIAKVAHIRPNCVSGTVPAATSASVGLRA